MRTGLRLSFGGGRQRSEPEQQHELRAGKFIVVGRADRNLYCAKREGRNRVCDGDVAARSARIA